MIINAKLIGKRIKEVRTARKMTQMLLAEKCDISDSYLRLHRVRKKNAQSGGDNQDCKGA